MGKTYDSGNKGKQPKKAGTAKGSTRKSAKGQAPRRGHWDGDAGKRGKDKEERGKNYLYGVHAVEAALLNPGRHIHKLFMTPHAAERLEKALSKRNMLPIDATPQELDSLVGDRNLVHQGVVAEVAELPSIGEQALQACQKILVLDQITDPHNVGAIMRSAAAYDVDAIVLTRHHTPPLTGIVSKTACGGLDMLKVHIAGNLARCLKNLGQAGFAIYGLDSEADEALESQSFDKKVVLVMGSEDIGLRRLTRENCDKMCAIQTGKANRLASLNVSNAAAVALHTLLVNEK